MRYQSEHGFTHPVLSPESDHYPEGQFTTRLHRPDAKDGNVQIVVDFELKEPYLEQLVMDGKAHYAAMLYCRATLHQQTVQAPDGWKRIDTWISAEVLRDAIEIYPLLVASETLELSTKTADPFFHDTTPVVKEGEPLATDRGWHFNLDVDSLPLGSIFQFIPDSTLTGPMQIIVDPNGTYVNIRVNATEFQEMNINRQQRLTIPSVFSAVLVHAIHRLQAMPDDEPVIIPGWVDTIRKAANKYNIDLGPDGENPFEAAQKLLGNPFQVLPQFQMRIAEEQLE